MYFVQRQAVFNMYRVTLIFYFIFVGVHSSLNLNNEKCNREDSACITRLADNFLRAAVKGDPSLKIETLDPMDQDFVEGAFSIVNYKLYNSTVVGLKGCNVVNTKLALEKSSMTFKLVCPSVNMFGIYEISGLLIIVPIEGKGDYRLDTKDYHIYIDTAIKVTEDKEGKRHLQFKNFKALGDLRGGMFVDLKNLFNGKHKELADAALKFANEYWRPVAREFQGPIVTANVKRIIKNLNKYLKTVALDKFIIY